MLDINWVSNWLYAYTSIKSYLFKNVNPPPTRHFQKFNICLCLIINDFKFSNICNQTEHGKNNRARCLSITQINNLFILKRSHSWVNQQLDYSLFNFNGNHDNHLFGFLFYIMPSKLVIVLLSNCKEKKFLHCKFKYLRLFVKALKTWQKDLALQDIVKNIACIFKGVFQKLC